MLSSRMRLAVSVRPSPMQWMAHPQRGPAARKQGGTRASRPPERRRGRQGHAAPHGENRPLAVARKETAAASHGGGPLSPPPGDGAAAHPLPAAFRAGRGRGERAERACSRRRARIHTRTRTCAPTHLPTHPFMEAAAHAPAPARACGDEGSPTHTHTHTHTHPRPPTRPPTHPPAPNRTQPHPPTPTMFYIIYLIYVLNYPILNFYLLF